MPWMDGLLQIPGANANNLGNQKQNGRLHYTVGVDSTGIGVNGYFHFLVPKNGTPKQFAPTEAVCWDACEWNPTGCGIEFERLSDEIPLTDSQILWGGRIIRWLNETDGIPLTFRDSPDDRMPVGTEYHGFTTHRSLHEVACDEHYDYVTQADWDLMIASTPSPLSLALKPKELSMIRLVNNTENSRATYELHEYRGERHYVGNPAVVSAMKAAAAASTPPVPVIEYDCDDEYLAGWKLVGPGFNGR